jgi:hypothetical protein
MHKAQVLIGHSSRKTTQRNDRRLQKMRGSAVLARGCLLGVLSWPTFVASSSTFRRDDRFVAKQRPFVRFCDAERCAPWRKSPRSYLDAHFLAAPLSKYPKKIVLLAFQRKGSPDDTHSASSFVVSSLETAGHSSVSCPTLPPFTIHPKPMPPRRHLRV